MFWVVVVVAAVIKDAIFWWDELDRGQLKVEHLVAFIGFFNAN